jgi:exosortase
MIAAVVGGLVAVSPFTPNEAVPSAIFGLIGAVIYLLYRTRLPPAMREVKDATSLFSSPLLWLLLVVWLAIFGQTLWWMYGRWTGSIWQNNHGLIVAIAMVIMSRRVILAPGVRDEDSSAWGFAFVVLGAAIVLLDSAIATFYTASFGLVVTLPGLSLLLLGKKKTRVLLPVFLLGLFLVPLPNSLPIHGPLRLFTADGVTHMINLMGLPVSQARTSLAMPGMDFLVSDACSGFATLVAGGATTVILAAVCRSKRRRWALAIVFLPLAMLSNIVRVTVLILLTNYAGLSLLETPVHEASGVASFCMIFVVLALVAGRPRVELRYAG